MNMTEDINMTRKANSAIPSDSKQKHEPVADVIVGRRDSGASLSLCLRGTKQLRLLVSCLQMIFILKTSTEKINSFLNNGEALENPARSPPQYF